MYGIGRAVQMPGFYVLVHADDLARQAALDRVETELRRSPTSIVARARAPGLSSSGLHRALIGAIWEILNTPGRLQHARHRWASMPRQRNDIAYAIDTLLAAEPGSSYPQPPDLATVAAALSLDDSQRDGVDAVSEPPEGPVTAPRAEQLVELIEVAAGLAPGVVGLVVDDGDAEPSAAIGALQKAPASLSVTMGASDKRPPIARIAEPGGRVLEAPAGDPAVLQGAADVATALAGLDGRHAAWALQLALCPDSEDALAWPVLRAALSAIDAAWADETPLAGLAQAGLLVRRSPPGFGGRARREAVLAWLAKRRPERVQADGRRAIRALAQRCAPPTISERPCLAALAAAADHAETLGLKGFERGYVAAARRLLDQGDHRQLLKAACSKAAERPQLPAAMGLLAAALGSDLRRTRDASLLAVLNGLGRHPEADAGLLHALAEPLAAFIDDNAGGAARNDRHPVGWEALQEAGDIILAWGRAQADRPALVGLAAEGLVPLMIHIDAPDARFADRLAQLRAWATPERPTAMAALARLLDRRAFRANDPEGRGLFGEPSQADLDELAALYATAPAVEPHRSAVARWYAFSLSRAAMGAYLRGEPGTRHRCLAALRQLGARYPYDDGILQAQSWCMALSVDEPLPGEDPVAFADELFDLASRAHSTSFVPGHAAQALANAHSVALEAGRWKDATGWLDRLRGVAYQCPANAGVPQQFIPALAESLRHVAARGAKPGPIFKEAARRLDHLPDYSFLARDLVPSVEELVELARAHGERAACERLRAHLHDLSERAQ